MARCTSSSSSRRSRLTSSGTSSGYCTARVPSCGEYANAPSRSNCASSRNASRRSEEHTSELQSLAYLVCRLLLEKKNAANERFVLPLGAGSVQVTDPLATHALAVLGEAYPG